MFPAGVTPITDILAFAKQDGQITYFSGQLPVFSHAENDTATFRMITSQFCVQGCAKQSDIIRAFGVTSISLKRSVKKYRDEGPKGFYAPRVTRGPAVLVDAVVAKAEERLAEGVSAAEVAADLQVKRNTLQKAIRAGRIRTPVRKNAALAADIRLLLLGATVVLSSALLSSQRAEVDCAAPGLHPPINGSVCNLLPVVPHGGYHLDRFGGINISEVAEIRAELPNGPW